MLVIKDRYCFSNNTKIGKTTFFFRFGINGMKYILEHEDV